jgi:hypothetical protein
VDGVITAIRSHPRVAGKSVPIIVAIEACASDGTFIGPMFLRHPGVLVMTEFSDSHKFGVPKNRVTLAGMIMGTKTFLSRGMISIPSDAIAFSSPNASLKMTMARYRSMLSVQFSNFRTDAATGVTNGKGGGANDDLLVSFMMTIYWMLAFPTKNLPEYIGFRDEYPMTCWAGAALIALGLDR